MATVFKSFIVSGAALVLSVGCSQAGETNPAEGANASPAAQSEAMGNWAVDRANSHIRFTGSQQGTEFSGHFGDFSAVINFDKAAVDKANVSVSIDVGSIDAGDKDRNGALPGRDWFFVKDFPTARFESDDFEHLGGESYEARGRLVMKGIEQDLTLPFTLEFVDGKAFMDSTFSIDRTLWNVGTGDWASGEWVGKDVALSIHIEASNPY